MRGVLVLILIAIILFLGYPYITSMNDGAGITPDSSLYKLDLLGEKITGLFTFDTAGRVVDKLESAKERLLEIKSMAKKDDKRALTKAYDQYVQLNLKSQLLLEELKMQKKNPSKSVQNIERNVVSQKEIISDIEIDDGDSKIKTLLFDYNNQLEKKIDQLKDKFDIGSILTAEEQKEVEDISEIENISEKISPGGNNGIVGLVVIDPEEFE